MAGKKNTLNLSLWNSSEPFMLPSNHVFLAHSPSLSSRWSFPVLFFLLAFSVNGLDSSRQLFTFYCLFPCSHPHANISSTDEKTEEKFYKQLLQNLHTYLQLCPRTLVFHSYGWSTQAPHFVQKVSTPLAYWKILFPEFCPLNFGIAITSTGSFPSAYNYSLILKIIPPLTLFSF